MITVILTGLGLGIAISGLLRGVRAPRPTPILLLRAMERPSRGYEGKLGRRSADLTPEVWWHRIRSRQQSLGHQLAGALQERGWLPSEISGWLAATESTVDSLCSEIVLAAVAGVTLPIAALAALGLAHFHIPIVVPIWASLISSAAAGALPIAALRNRANETRRDARAVLASFLDLVVLGLAGGMGIESALHAAAAIADDNLSRRILRDLQMARDTGDTPWAALSHLGAELGVSELIELSASVSLAGTEGARVRATLTAKAESIRRHDLFGAETAANTLTERLFVPGALLLIGFLMFVGYPAVARISSGF